MSAAPARYDYIGAREDVFSSPLPGTLKLLLLALIEHMPICEPSVATLAQRCSIDRKTVMRALARLERIDVLSVERMSGRRSRYLLQPVPSWRTGITEGPVPEERGTGTNRVSGPVPTRPQTSPTAAGHEAEEADPESSLKHRRARDLTSTRMGPVPFDAPVLSTEHLQYPKGWRWSEATDGDAAIAGVNAAELQEHVDYWTTHKWAVPVTDLDGELRRSIPKIRKRNEQERFKASQRSLSALTSAAASNLETTAAATWFRPTSEHERYCAESSLKIGFAVAEMEKVERFRKLGTPQQNSEFMARLRCWKALGRFIADGPMPKPATRAAQQIEARPHFKGALPSI